MDIRQIRYFLKICESGTISGAAEALFITQQTLSSSISSLENEFGLPLFIRSRHGVDLTEFGVLFKEYAERVVHEFNIMEFMLHSACGKIVGEISLGIATGLERFFPPSFLISFREQYPTVQLNIIKRDGITCSEMILNDRIDAAIVLGPVKNQSLDSIVLMKSKMVAVVGKDHPLATRETISVLDFKDWPLISSSETNQNNLIVLCENCGFSPNIIYSTIFPPVMHDLCSRGNYIGFSVEHVINKVVNDDIRKIPIENDAYQWEMDLIVSKGCRKIANKRLISFIQSSFERGAVHLITPQ